jgi:hypothetical protein
MQEQDNYPMVLLHICRYLKMKKTDSSVGWGESRVARFFLVQHTKTGKNIPNNHKIYRMATE